METVVCAAIEYEGKIICGPRHFHCFQYAEVLLADVYLTRENTKQGFITSEGRFLDREEAATLIKKTGQKTKFQVDGWLTSEDLY